MSTPKLGMAPFHSQFNDFAFRETRVLTLRAPESGLPPGEYAFIEFYCVDPECDCRRVVLQVWPRGQAGTVLATINYGWEAEQFYTQWMGGDAETARDMAGATLDLFNPQSQHSEILLSLFQEVVLKDTSYIERLGKHYRMFRERISTKPSDEIPTTAYRVEHKIPKDRRERFDEVAGLIEGFTLQHLDDETAGFTLELWARMCRRKAPDCMRGKAQVWAASVIHVIARMNFLFDKNQPVHLTFETICNFFQTKKTTVGRTLCHSHLSKSLLRNFPDVCPRRKRRKENKRRSSRRNNGARRTGARQSS